ncbi:MAG: response regulator, partial [Puniceicoccales bacterium]
MNDSLFLVSPDGRARSQLSLILRELGRKVVSSTDPHDAIRQISEFSYPVVIIDRDLPGVNGLEFVREVAKTCASTHVVLLSDEADAVHTPPRGQLGISDIIYRPFKPARLMKKIEGLCNDAGLKSKPVVQPGLTRAPFSLNGSRNGNGSRSEPNQSYQSLSYHPSFMVAKSTASRRLLGDLWNARGFKNAVMLLGEDGSEFELVVRELNQ